MNKLKLVTLTSLFLLGTSFAGVDDENFGSLKVKEVTSIYDGDTFRANIEGVHPLMGKRIGIRVSNVDTPEIRGKCPKEKVLAKKAKQITVAVLREAKTIELRNVTRGKYFRIVADVYADGQNLTKILINSGYAVPYDGGKKSKDWCI
jgi:endonuclease YncB( thermonuclease family)